MKLRRVFALLILWCACALAQAQGLTLAPIPPLTSPVIDTTGTLDAATRQALEQQAVALQQRKGSQLQVLVVPTTQPEDIAQYAVRAFDQWKIGRKGVDDGVLLVVAKDDRRVRIEVGYGLEGAIPDATAIRVISEYLVPKFRGGDYAGGIRDASAVLVKLIDGEPLPAPMVEHRTSRGKGSNNWLVALFAAFFIGNLAMAVLRKLPRLVRGLFAAAAAGTVATLIATSLMIGAVGAAIGFFCGLARPGTGRFARDSGWGSGGFGGGGFGGGGGWSGGGGGGWSGGGGMSGGGGASGSW